MSSLVRRIGRRTPLTEADLCALAVSAWGRSLHTADKVTTIADSSLAWLKAAGLVQDLSHVGFGERAKRFALIVDDLKVGWTDARQR